MLVRDIIDIDSTYEDFEASNSNEDEIKDKKDLVTKKLKLKKKKKVMKKTQTKK